MDYRLATAMRGPDHETDGAGAWKVLVTAPLRWFAAKLIRRSPDHWTNGFISSPSQVYSNLKNTPLLNRALKFTNSKQSGHVKTHALDAFNYLKTTSQKDAATKLYDTLVAKGLL